MKTIQNILITRLSLNSSSSASVTILYCINFLGSKQEIHPIFLLSCLGLNRDESDKRCHKLLLDVFSKTKEQQQFIILV